MRGGVRRCEVMRSDERRREEVRGSDEKASERGCNGGYEEAPAPSLRRSTPARPKKSDSLRLT